MKLKKLVGILVMMLLISTAIPIVNSKDKNEIKQLSNEDYCNDYGCGSNSHLKTK
jgi:hypothetical protein